jgi:hypothetical protein
MAWVPATRETHAILFTLRDGRWTPKAWPLAAYVLGR